VLLVKLYQIDIIYEFYEKLTKERIESTDLETAIRQSIKFLDDYKDENAFVHKAYMIIGEEKVLITQKVIDLINRSINLINRRKYGKSRME
jgi:hypothetical protein